MTKIRSRAAIAIALAAGLALSACGGGEGAASGSGDTTLDIVGFAVPEQANKAIAAEWAKTPEGKGVRFKTSYDASGDQSRAVVAGLKADYVHFWIVTPNPASSGPARWNALAAWGHIAADGGTEQQATDYLRKLFADAAWVLLRDRFVGKRLLEILIDIPFALPTIGDDRGPSRGRDPHPYPVPDARRSGGLDRARGTGARGGRRRADRASAGRAAWPA